PVSRGAIQVQNPDDAETPPTSVVRGMSAAFTVVMVLTLLALILPVGLHDPVLEGFIVLILAATVAIAWRVARGGNRDTSTARTGCALVLVGSVAGLFALATLGVMLAERGEQENAAPLDPADARVCGPSPI